MKKNLLLTLLASIALHAGNVIFEDGFENGLINWTGEAAIIHSDERAASGKYAMEITGRGSVRSKAIPVKPETRYRVRVNSYSTGRGTFHLIIEPYDASMKLQSIPGSFSTSEGLWDADRKKQKRNYWMPVQVGVDTGKDTAFVRIRIYKTPREQRLWIDSVTLEEVAKWPELRNDAEVTPPYTCDSLMLPGPDGYLYPNFTRAGLSRPWTLPKQIFKVEEFGAVADDGKDDSDAIDRAVEAAVKVNGGVIFFGPGTYRLSRKISIRHDNIVFRGVDQAKSRLELGLPDNQIGIFSSGSDNRLSPRATVQVFFPCDEVRQVMVRAGNEESVIFQPARFEKLPDKLDFGKVIFRIEPFFEKLGGEGLVSITAEVSYGDGRVEKTTVPFILDRNHRPNVYASSYLTFSGRDLPPHQIMLTSELKRGEKTFTIDNAERLKSGDLIALQLPVASRWAPVNNNVPWWRWIDFQAEIAEVNDSRITIAQPVRFDFPLAEKPCVSRLDPIKNSGIENLTLSQVGKIQIELKMRTVSFNNAWNCRAANLIVDRPGTSAIYGVRMKNCEFINCKFTQPWRTKFGGLAYIGWDRAWDCLLSGVESYGMRHAPLFNWSCSGNVVTDSFFNESDAQWHTGWCHDNLIENSRIVTTTNKFNSYGWAFYAVPAEDAEHGGIGPRNVVYNCETTSFRGGLYLGGYNRNWLIMYNKFHITKGPGVLERLGGGENTFVGNTFVLEDKTSPAFFLESLDNRGNIIKNNILYGGNGVIVAGPATPAQMHENRSRPFRKNENITRPMAPVPSLYKWQKETCK